MPCSLIIPAITAPIAHGADSQTTLHVRWRRLFHSQFIHHPDYRSAFRYQFHIQAPRVGAFSISGLKMQNQFQISFYKNSKGATVGSLSFGNKPLLATTHPATIAYALQALGVESIEIVHELTRFEMSLPSVMVMSSNLSALGQHAEWLSNFMRFSQIDSFNPASFDTQADIHLRTAIHFLPKNLVVRKPTSAERPNWKKELKFRKDFIYVPLC
jgi:hypothetical protein